MTDYPAWLATEMAVEHFFILLGFNVESISISGRQIDVLAHRVDAITGERDIYIIEVTLEKVGVEKGSKDGQKLLLAREEHKNARLMLVSMSGFTDDQEATLKRLGIVPRRFHELESTLLPLHRYALNTQRELARASAPDIGYHPSFYIEPELTIRYPEDNRTVASPQWMESVLYNPQPGLCAVLGSLGSGKTSLLKRLLERGISRFLSDPDMQPLPLYVPLGRYKQHAGDLNQMLMAELSRSGVQSYPTSYIQFLLDQRRIIILLDGLDEVHPIQNTDDVLETVTNILEGVGKQASGVISCRRQFFESSAEEQAYFGSYTAGKLRDLNFGLQKLLRGHTSTYIAEILPFDSTRIKQYLFLRCELSSDDSETLLSQYYGFPDMATTPVLLAMIATTVTEGTLNAECKLSFPHIQLYEAYTTRWIERDVGRARLSANQRLHFSEYLADRMLWESKESAAWSEMSEALRHDPDWGNNPLTHEEAELDIRNSGFLIRELDDKWRFIHRSILEYFAARAELGRLRAAERPRYIPTDGYKLFLIELLARSWIESGESPIPPRSWAGSRGHEVLSNQWSLLAAASRTLPEGASVTLSGVGSLEITENFEWVATNFHSMNLTISGGYASFSRCKFSNCQITITENTETVTDFADCIYELTDLKFEAFPVWITAYDASTRDAVAVSIAVWDFSRAVEAGAQVYVGDRKWSLRSTDLEVFLECARRLKGKVYAHNFVRGFYAKQLQALLPFLIQQRLVREDSSRQSHQLSWTSQGRALVTKLRTDPVGAQAEVSSLFPCQDA
jgi:hypothetical protein